MHRKRADGLGRGAVMLIHRLHAPMALLVLGAGLLAYQAANLTGSWHLNVQKSTWGKRSRPVAVDVTIEHNEPALKYSGRVIQDAEGRTTNFNFEGAIDGKPYPIPGSSTGETIAIRRVDARTITSESKAADGQVGQTARTTISRDGRTLYRTVRLKTSDGVEVQWTEVYEKK